MPLRQQSKRRLTLAVDKWPDSDRCAWEDACRPGSRLKRGGRASHLAEASRDNLERRYGGFLKFLQRTERLEIKADAAVQVTPANVEAYVQELTRRVSSVSVHTYIYCLRRIAMLLAPANDFSWLGEIEKDLALGWSRDQSSTDSFSASASWRLAAPCLLRQWSSRRMISQLPCDCAMV